MCAHLLSPRAPLRPPPLLALKRVGDTSGSPAETSWSPGGVGVGESLEGAPGGVWSGPPAGPDASAAPPPPGSLVVLMAGGPAGSGAKGFCVRRQREVYQHGRSLQINLHLLHWCAVRGADSMPKRCMSRYTAEAF